MCFIFTDVPAVLRAGIAFVGICLSSKSVCLSAKNLEDYWSEIDVTW